MTGPQIVPTTNTDWQNDAACAGHPEPDLFHPVPGGMTRDKAQQIRDAKDVCGWCPVKAECLAVAVHNGFEGIWGGTTDEQRRGMRPKRTTDRRPNQPTPDERCGTYSGSQRHRKRDESLCDGCRDARNEYEAPRKKARRAALRAERVAS